MSRWWFEEAERRPSFDWKKFADGTVRFFEALAAGAAAAERIHSEWEAARATATPPPNANTYDADVIAAASLLGIRPDAAADDARAALRVRMTTSCIHPDHGGDGELASQLIAAKNLLVERSKVRS